MAAALMIATQTGHIQMMGEYGWEGSDDSSRMASFSH